MMNFAAQGAMPPTPLVALTFQPDPITGKLVATNTGTSSKTAAAAAVINSYVRACGGWGWGVDAHTFVQDLSAHKTN
jgi:hypothetical protein